MYTLVAKFCKKKKKEPNGCILSLVIQEVYILLITGLVTNVTKSCFLGVPPASLAE